MNLRFLKRNNPSPPPFTKGREIEVTPFSKKGMGGLIRNLKLMVIVPVVGCSLIPFPFIIFAADFLSKIGISHIDKPKKEATQMGEVSNAPSCSLHGREEFDEAIDDDQVFSRNGEEKIDVNESIWEKPAEGQKYSVDGTRGSDYGDKLIGREDDSTNSGPHSTEEEIDQKLSRSPVTF